VVSIILPKKIERKLREEAERRVATEEEIIIEVLSKMLDVPVNFDERVEIHLKLSEKYMGEAEEFIKKGNYTQASEKAWGAASQAVKALAIKRGKELRSHRELHEFVAKISEELKDKEIGRLWRSATSLHQNFYEDWFTESQVLDGVEDARKLIEKLTQLVK
jgi:uncharacterized protein (UPF0332 family)